ncbi:MAG: hypothetical protein PVI57_19860 [Gemmatimonadota bacterium]
MTVRHRTASILLVPLLFAGGCRPSPPDWIPVLEETSTSFLETGLARNLERVTAARDVVRTDPVGAEEMLAEAERDLRSLREVYVPLLEARNLAYNAYRFHHLGRDDEAVAALETIQRTVLSLSDGAEGSLLAELERVEELVAHARIETGAGSTGAEVSLRRLADALAHFVAKADLFL